MLITPTWRCLRTVVALACVTAFSASVHAQTVEDGIMMGRKGLFTGMLYAHDGWDEYWEGALKRGNGNIGTLTTETVSWYADYGLTNRLNVIANIPYIRTNASQGVLHGMSGVQDLMVAGKYRLFERTSRMGLLRGIGVAAGGLPLTDYTPDFQPLSIGFQSKRLSGRFTLNVQSGPGWYANASTAYTWRGGVTLDRPYYYTNGQFFMTDQVSMPEVFDYVVSGGYLKDGVHAVFSFTQQRMRGGGDIRRQDAPFISNRMNFSKFGGMVMYPVPKVRELAAQFSYGYVVEGRNVGQSTTITAGLFYRFHLFGSDVQ
jgi:hypothetical protein